MILWFTGRSGAGKSVFAKYLREKHGFLEIDGDQMRKTISKDLGFTPGEKVEHGRRMISLCKMFVPQKDIVVSTITATDGDDFSGRNMVYKELGEYGVKIIWIRASLDACRYRDPKGVYAKNPPYLAGVNESWEDPARYDLCLDTETETVLENCIKLDRFLGRNL